LVLRLKAFAKNERQLLKFTQKFVPIKIIILFLEKIVKSKECMEKCE